MSKTIHNCSTSDSLIYNVKYCYDQWDFSFTPLRGKVPLLKEWHTRPKETRKEALEWARQGNVGLRCGRASNLVVLDFDEGADINGTIERFDLSQTLAVHTGGGGLHMYLHYDSDRNPSIGNDSQGKLGKHIHVRGEGGQVVFAGSVHPETGRNYDWHTGCAPWEVELAPLPQAVADILLAPKAKTQTIASDQPTPRATAYLQAALKGETQRVATTNKGDRNNVLNDAAFRLGRFVPKHLAHHTVESALFGAARQCGLLDEDGEQQTRATIQSGIEAGMREPCDPPDTAEANDKQVTLVKQNALVQPVLTRLSDVAPQPVQWLWPGRIAIGKLTLICGDPGLGKSFVTLDLAARTTTGQAWPDGEPNGNGPGRVILLNAEDDLSDTIRPRLDAAHADPQRVIALTGREWQDANGQQARANIGLGDIATIETAIQQTPDCQLVIVDPVSAYMGRLDSHKNADVRAVLAPLAELANRYRVAVVMVTHLNKMAGGRALYRAMGSLGFVAATRAAFLVVADQRDPARRLFLPMKNNLGRDRAGLAYRLVDGAVAWESGAINVSADEALAAQADRAGGQGVRHAATEWLRDLLAEGPMEAVEIEELAEAAGFKGSLRRARESLPIKVYRERGSTSGPWWWRIVENGA